MNLFGDDDNDDASVEPYGENEAIGEGDGLLPPREMSFCLGHKQQEDLFLDLFQKKSLPHAMIFSGERGIGKSTMAFRLARFLFKNAIVENSEQDSLFAQETAPQDIKFSTLDVDVNDPVFIRIASGGYKDLLYIERYYDSTKNKLDADLKVAALRKIESFLRMTASKGGWRIVIVDDADTMNRNAQNAILKILEEPPANVLIILIAHRLGRLIPTIRSRSRVIEFAPLSYEDMNELLKINGHNISNEDLEILHLLSEGSIGNALRLIDEEGIEALSGILDRLDDFPNWDWVKIHELSASLSGNAQDINYRVFVELMVWLFRYILSVKARGRADLPHYLQRESIHRIINNYSLEELIRISDGLKEHFERVDFANLDRREAVRSAFLVIHE